MAELYSYAPHLQTAALRIQPKNILEWGPGKSTELLVELMPQSRILSIEHDINWYRTIIEDLVRPNLEVHHIPHLLPYGGSEGYATYPIRWLAERGFPLRFFDLIFVDGRSRCDCIVVASLVVRDNGAVVVHDSERESYRKAFGLFSDFEDFGGTSILSRPRRDELCGDLPKLS